MRPIWFLLLLSICAAPLLAQPQILYYKFNETSGAIAKNNAVPGQGYDNAVFSAAPNWNTTDPVLGAAAVDNTGLDRRLSTGYSMSERNGQDYTIEFFFRTTGTGYQDLVNDSDTFAIWIFNGRIQVYMDGVVRVQSSNTDNNDGEWRYCALRRQGGQTRLFWATDTGGLSFATTNYNMTFANRALELLHWQGAPPAGNFDGEMDEFRLWSVARNPGQLDNGRSIEQSAGDMEVFDSNGANINHTSTTRYTRVDGSAFTDYTFSVLNTRTGGSITFTPVTFTGDVGVTAAVITNPTTIPPGQTTDFAIRLTPTAPEFSVVVNINNSRSPDPYQFTIEGLVDTGLPEMLYYRFNAGTGNQAANDASPGRGNNPAVFSTGPVWNTVDPRLPGAAVASNASMPTGFVATELPKVDFTAEFWMRTTATTGTVAMFGDGVSFSAFLFNGALRVRGGVQVLDISGVYNDGNWHHVAIVSDPGTYGIRVYRNGVQVFQQVNFSFPFSNSPLTVMSNGGTQNFSGQIDEFRLWAYARSATEIAADMGHELFGRLDVQRPAATSIAAGGIDDIGSLTPGIPALLDYTLENVGGRVLTMGTPAITFSGASNCNVSITTNPSGAAVAAAGTIGAQVEITAIAPGAISVQLQFHSDDPDVPAYVVNVTGTAVGVPAIQVERPASTIIAHNGSDSITALGPVAGVTLNYIYIIRNTGSATLNLTGGGFSANTNCTVSVGPPASINVAPGGTTTMPVGVTPGVGGGAFSFVLHIDSNAPAIATYNVNVSGTAAPGGVIEIDRGGPPFVVPATDTVLGAIAGQQSNLNYTITNTGTGTLSSIAAAVQGTPVNCSVNVGTPGSSSLLITQSTGLLVGVTPGIGGGAFSFVLRVTSNATVNGIFDITVSGNAAPGGATQVERAGPGIIPAATTDTVTGAVAGQSTGLTYTIRNIGTGTLSAIATSVAGTPVNISFGAVFPPGSTSLTPAATTTFNLTFTPANAGAFSFVVRVSSNAAASPYDFTVAGNAAAGGEIEISRGGPAFTNPQADTATGTLAGAQTILTYNITNAGTATLGSIAAALNGAPSNCGVIVNPVGASSLGVGGNTSFTVELTPGVAGGAFSFTLHVTSDDTTNGTFVINVSGTAALAGAIEISRGAPPFANPGADTMTPATAGVQANLTCDIVNTGTGTLSNIVASQFGAATNCSVNVGTPGSSTLAALGGATTLAVDVTPDPAGGAFSFTLRITSDDTVNGTFDIVVSGNAALAGAIQISRSGPTFSNPGADTVTPATAGVQANLTYDIANTGTGTLSNIVASQFGVANNCSVIVGTPGSSSLAASGGATTLTVQVTPSPAGGAFSFTLRTTSDDTVNGTFDIVVSGNAALAGAIQISRGGPTFANPGADTVTPATAGVQANLTYDIVNTGTGTLSNIVASQFGAANNCSVNVGTPGSSSLAALGGATTLAVQVTPDPSGGAFSFTLRVTSDDTVNGTFDVVVSGTAALAGAIEISRGAPPFTNPGADTVTPATAGVQANLTYNILNTGTGTLSNIVASQFGAATNCSVNVGTPGSSSLAALGGATTLAVGVTPDPAGGAFSFTLRITSDDTVNGTFDIVVSGNAALAGAIQISRGGPTFANPGADTVTPATAGVQANLTYNIVNTGTGTLSNIVAAQFGAANNCAVIVGTPGSSSLAALGGNTTLAVDVTPDPSGGAFSFTLRITSDDTVNGTFDIVVSGNAAVNGVIELDRAGSIAHNDTDTLGGTQAGVQFNLVYTISNAGAGTLTLNSSPVSISGETNCAVNLVAQPSPLTLLPGEDVSFTLQVTPGVAGGSYSFDVAIASNATNHDPFEFDFAANAALNGQIQLERTGTIGFQTTDTEAGTQAGVLFGLTYTIRNIGLGTLTLTGATPVAVLNATGCSISNLAQPGTLSLAPGATTTFSFDVTPAVSGGAYSFDVEVASNATNHTTFEFDFVAAAALNGVIELDRTGPIAHNATDTQAGTQAGVQFNLVYTISNAGAGTLTLNSSPVSISGETNCAVNLVAQPAPLTLLPGEDVSFTLQVTPGVAGGAYSFDVAISSNATNHAPFNFDFDATATVNGNIELERTGLITHTGSDTEPGTLAGAQFPLVYTIRNLGPGTLTLNAVPVSVSGQTACAVVIHAQPGSLVLGPSATTTFELRVTPDAAAGAYSFGVQIDGNAVNHASFNFSFSATAGFNGSMTISRGGPAFSNPGADTVTPAQAGVLIPLVYDLSNGGPGNLGSIAASQFGASVNCAVNVGAPGASSLNVGGNTTLAVDVTPGIAGGAFSFTLRVTSNDPANGTFDILASGNATPNGNIELRRADTSLIGYQTQDTQASTLAGASFSRVYTIRNDGPGTLTLSASPVTVFNQNNCAATLQAQPGTLVLSPGATVNFTVDVTPDALGGTYGFEIAVASDAANQTTFEFFFEAVAGLNGQVQLERGAVIDHLTTDTEGSTVAGVQFSLTYTIRNIGLGNLTLTGANPVSVPVQNNCTVAIFAQPGTLVLAPGATTTFQLDVTPGVSGGNYDFDVSIASNATNHPAFAFDFVAAAALAGAIEISRGAPPFANPGADTVTPATAGVQANLTYNITNTGTGTLSNIVAVQFGAANNCSVNIGTPGASSLAALGGATTLAVQVTPSPAGGAFSFTLRITSDDTVNGTFDIVVSGNAALAGAIQISRGGPTFGNPGADTVTPATAGVQANLTYNITNTGTGTLSNIVASQFGAANNCSVNVGTPGASSLAALGGATTLAVQVTPDPAGGAFSFTLRITSDDTANGTFDIVVSGNAALAGAIQISRGATFSNPGADTVTPATAGVQANLTYNITNTGTGTLSNIVASQFGAATNCSVNIGTPGSSSLTALGGNTTLAVDVTPDPAGGAFSFTLRITSDDTVNGTFDIVVSGNAALAGAIQIGRGGPTFGNPGADTVTPATAGVQANLTYDIANTGTGTLSTIVAAQFGAANNCSVIVGTLGSSSLAALGGATTLAVQVTPSPAGGAFSFTLRVTSDDPANGTFDVVVSGNAGVNGVIELDRTAPIAHNGTDTQGGTQAGVQFNLVYTISNSGLGTLTLNSSPVGISGETNCVVNLVAQPAPLTLLPGEDVSFTLQVTPGVSGGNYDFDVSIASNATNHAPFNFNFAASATVAGDLEIERLAVILPGGTDTVTGATAGVVISPQLAYTIYNNGTGSVDVTSVQILGGSNFNVNIIALPFSATIPPMSNTTFTINAVEPQGTGAFGFTLRFTSNDPTNPQYDVIVAGNAASGGEIDVQRPAANTLPHNGSDTEAGTIAGFATPLQYTIQNLGGTAALAVGAVTVPAISQSNCSVAIISQPGSASLAINAATTFQLEVTPTAPGLYSFILEVASDDTDENPYIINFSATAVAPATIDAPPSAGFGSSNVGIGVPQTVQLDSIGGVDLVITSIQVIGAQAGDWAITSAAPPPGSVNVAPAGSFNVDLLFTPTATGNRNAQLEIISNHTGTPGTQTLVDLSGFGTTGNLSTNLTVNYPNTPATFTSSSVNHVLANLGDGPARITSVSALAGADPGAWQLFNLPAPNLVLASLADHTIQGEFTPPGVGTYTAEFTVFWDNGPGSIGNSFTVQLSGDGVVGSSVTGVVVAPDNGGPVEVTADVNGPVGSFIDVAVTYTGGLSPGPAVLISAGAFVVTGNVVLNVPANTQLVLLWNAYATEGHHSAANYVITLSPSIGVQPGTPGSSAMFALNRQGGWVKPGPRDAVALPLHSHAMIHDVTNNRLVAFGGFRAGLLISEVWVYDLAGDGWQPLYIPGTKPSSRRRPAAVYDGARNRMVVFGGLFGSTFINDTWALDLTPGNESWTQIAMASAATPAGRMSAALVVDAANDRAVMYGGRAAGSFSDVWVLDLTSDDWGAGAVTISGSGPGALRDCAAAWDAPGNRMVIYGGAGGPTYARTWELVLEPTPAWTLLLSTGPSARSKHSYAFDSSRRSLVIHGGEYSAAIPMDDTWRLDLATLVWEQLADDPASPGGRFDSAAVYDSVGDRLLIHGGRDNPGKAYSDLISLSLAGTPAWQPSPDAPNVAAGPANRTGALMAADQNSSRIFVWGGRDGATYFDDLYQLDRNTGVWSIVNVGATRPSARAYAGWTFDEVNNRLIICGGEQSGGFRTMDVWSLSLTGAPVWTQWTTSAGPSARINHAIAYDHVTDRLFLFGGQDPATRDDLWVLDAGSWSQPSTVGPIPSARFGHGATFDVANNRFVVIQGLIGSTGIDTIYELDMNPATPTWADITPVAPLAFGRGRFAYAARNQGAEVWMHGGVRSSFTSKDLWMLDLSVPGAATWTETVVPGGPSDRAEHSACLDAAGVFMAGLGQRATLPSRDIWRIDTTAPAGGWANLDQNDIPRGLTFAYSALDASNNRMISFGGVVDMRPVDGVHALDLNSAAGTWQRLNPTGPGPSPRFAGSMVYDDGGLYPRMILFGGRQSHYSADITDEVWELNLTPGAEAWTLLTTSFSGSTNNPGRRSWHPAILDDSRRMIVYGGGGLYDSRQDTTFALDVDTLVWTRLVTAGPTPPARVFHGANYDNLGGRNRMVVFGGYNTYAFNDTWELDLNTHTWTLLSNTGIPPIQVHSQVLDPIQGRIVVFGGWDVDSQASCGLYEFDLVTHTWVEIITGTMVPQSRYGHTAVWDTLRSRMVLAGGQTYAQTMVTQNGGLEVDLWYWGD